MSATVTATPDTTQITRNNFPSLRETQRKAPKEAAVRSCNLDTLFKKSSTRLHAETLKLGAELAGLACWRSLSWVHRYLNGWLLSMSTTEPTEPTSTNHEVTTSEGAFTSAA